MFTAMSLISGLSRQPLVQAITSTSSRLSKYNELTWYIYNNKTVNVIFFNMLRRNFNKNTPHFVSKMSIFVEVANAVHRSLLCWNTSLYKVWQSWTSLAGWQSFCANPLYLTFSLHFLIQAFQASALWWTREMDGFSNPRTVYFKV